MLDVSNAASLREYLISTRRIAASDAIEISPLSGGVSAQTVLVRLASGDEWVVKQALTRLRVQTDWFSNPVRIHREAEALRFLPKIAPTENFTPLIFEDFEHHLLAMKAVAQPHENLKTLLLSGAASRQRMLPLFKTLGQLLRSIHRRENLPELFKDRSFFESLRIEPYYLFAAEQVPEASTFLLDLVSQTRARTLSLVHGDYSPKNVLVRGDQIVLLDHEVVHVGDPAFDIGFFLTHLLAKSHHLPHQRELFGEAANTFFRAYAADAEMEPYAVRHTLGCLLARVAGRSLLEYLTETQRETQRRAVLRLVENLPTSVEGLIEEFLRCTKSSS